METETNNIEKTLFKLIDSADVTLLYLDTNENVLICNKKANELTGFKSDDIIGRHWAAVLYRKTEASVQQQMLKAMISDAVTYKRSNNFEGAVLNSSGVPRLISWSIIPIFSEEKELEGILCLGHDITELKEKEDAVKKIDETVKNIFSSLKEYALYVANLDGNITYYGMGAELMFGWQKSEIIFKNFTTLHPGDNTAADLAVMLEKVRTQARFEGEINLIRKNNEVFPVVLTINQYLDSEGKLSGYVFMAKDITERKKLEYHVFQTEKLAAIGQLAAGMAHEINNPLFVISGRMEMLLENNLPDNIKKDTTIVLAQVERIRKLVDRLLKFARKTPPKLELVGIKETIEGVLPFLAYHKMPAASYTIEKELAEDLPPVKVDINQLQEVFLNLLINAHQAMPEGGKVSIKTRNLQNQFAEIRISDTGEGIPLENIKNLFMPFFSTKKDGTGLGLSICFNIIKNHNGTIEIESQPKKGTTFIVKLPFAKDQDVL